MNYVSAALVYVMGDPWFWPSMAFTTIVGIFIAAVIHDGDLDTLKKSVWAIGAYFVLMILTNISRILAQFTPENLPTINAHPQQPFASIATFLLVTLFYAIGMFTGVLLVRRAHKK